MNYIIRLLIIVFIPLTSFAEPQAVNQLKSFLAKSQTLSADFKQVSIDERGNPGASSQGLFYLQRPGKFRWDYIQPFKQQIVSEQGKVWFYDEDLEQVTIKKIDQSLGATPALLLSGEIQLEDNFNIEQQGVDVDMQWLRLTPKSEENSFKYILIGLEDGALAGMELSDNFGQLTRIYFSNVKINPALNPNIFKFTIPEGVDVFSE